MSACAHTYIKQVSQSNVTLTPDNVLLIFSFILEDSRSRVVTPLPGQAWWEWRGWPCPCLWCMQAGWLPNLY